MEIGHDQSSTETISDFVLSDANSTLVAALLGQKTTVTKCWKNLGQQLEISSEKFKKIDCGQFSPTEAFMEYLSFKEADLTVKGIYEAVKEFHRTDVFFVDIRKDKSRTSSPYQWWHIKNAPVYEYLRERLSDPHGCKLKLISGVYGSDIRNKGNQVFKIEHCALQEHGNQWNLEVKYRAQGSKAPTTPWIDVWEFYPDAAVKVEHNYIELTIPSPKDYHEFAVFGIPEMKDKKRMQLAVFSEKPAEGKDSNILVTLFDDTVMAFEHLCDREKSKGRQLLTTLAALFVSNNDKDIEIKISALEEGWQIIGSKVKTIKSKDAWNSPENSTDFPSCVFEISHVDETKQLFSCDVTALHSNDTAKTEVVAFFEQKNDVHFTSQAFISSHETDTHEDKITDVFVFLQILAFMVGCFTGAGFAPIYQSAGSKGHHA